MVESVTRANRITFYFPPDEGWWIAGRVEMQREREGKRRRRWGSRGWVKRTKQLETCPKCSTKSAASERVLARVYTNIGKCTHGFVCVCVCVRGVSFLFLLLFIIVSLFPYIFVLFVFIYLFFWFSKKKKLDLCALVDIDNPFDTAKTILHLSDDVIRFIC